MNLTPNTHLDPNTLIKQPVPSDLRLQTGTMQLTERWKGQYTHCQDVLRNMYSTSADIEYSRFVTAAGVLSQEYATPNPPNGLTWVLEQGRVDEIDAGENGILECIWSATYISSDVGPTSETWSLNWQAQNYDVYAYCSNPSAHVDIGSSSIKSQRSAVEQCLHPPVGNNIMTNAQLFQMNSGLINKLNENEQKILEWKQKDMHPIFHHPQLTKTKTWNNVSYTNLSTLLSSIKQEIKQPDVIDNPGFPLSGYVWVTQGTQIQTSQQDIRKNTWTAQTQTTWVGALSVVEEFYSNEQNKRWKLGEM